jgi:hypothetical protein
MNRRRFLTTAAQTAVAISGAAKAKAASNPASGRLRIVSNGTVYDSGPGIISGSARCKNDDLLVAFNTGGDIGAGQRVGILRSKDGGKTWSAPETWFESIFKKGGIETGCSLTCLSSGRLLLPYADGFYLNRAKGYDRHALLFCPISEDNGRTWRNTKAECYEGLEAFAFGTVVELPGGTLLLPLWGAYDRQGVWGCGLLKSKDGGLSWSDWRPIVREGGDETPIILLPDGRLLALIRGHTKEATRPFHVAWSSDAGDTWSAPLKVELFGTSPSLHLTPKGNLLAGYRSTLPGGRCHVSSSADGGKTWQFELELEPPGGKWDRGGYPAFENLPDGRVFVTFHTGVPGKWGTYWNVVEEVG